MIILDFGSGETCRNSRDEVDRMLAALKEVDSGRRRIIIKWQLFQEVPEVEGVTVTPLDREVFDYAYKAAKDIGYETTSSVFDYSSLSFLLSYPIPFVKIACRPSLYTLMMKIPEDMQTIVSVSHPFTTWDFLIGTARDNFRLLCCVPEYPANQVRYETMFGGFLSEGISDHSEDFKLFHKYEPTMYERHFKLEDSEGLDNGPWASTPEDLKEIL